MNLIPIIPPLKGGRGMLQGALMSRRKIIPYDGKLKSLARKLRNESTLPEILLWNQLKKKQLKGFQFLRQKPIDQYIVDFFCPDLNLAVEIDGEYHDEVLMRDDERQRRLESLGISMLRFTNMEVKNNLEGVCESILIWIERCKDS
jgi:very-short-patch-repair endonuclease